MAKGPTKDQLEASAQGWLNILADELGKTRNKGLGKDGRPKSRFSPVQANSIGRSKGEGGILDSTYEVVETDSGFELIFNLPGYILALENGVVGGRYEKRPRGNGGQSLFIKSLLDWIKTKGITTELKPLSLALAIRTNIFKEGIAPINILSTVNERFFDEYGEEIANKIMVNIEDQIIDNIQRIENSLK